MATGWLTPADALAIESYWPGAGDVNPDEIGPLLASAQIQCAAYAPDLITTVTNPDGTTTVTEGAAPDNYLHAQALQARALYRAALTGDRDGIGADGYTVTVFPMDWTVKNLLRPKKGRPVLR